MRRHRVPTVIAAFVLAAGLGTVLAPGSARQPPARAATGAARTWRFVSAADLWNADIGTVHGAPRVGPR